MGQRDADDTCPSSQRSYSLRMYSESYKRRRRYEVITMSDPHTMTEGLNTVEAYPRGCSLGRRVEDSEDQSEGHHSGDHRDNRRSESFLPSNLL
jgi:hypothetical protein